MAHTDSNHLLSSLKTLSPPQARRLRQRLDRQLVQPKKRPAPGKGAKPAKKLLTEAEFHQHLLSIGLITSLPNPALDIDDDDPDDAPVPIKGEPLSEILIRERRSRWPPAITRHARPGSLARFRGRGKLSLRSITK
jgi:hypothetical protein